MGENGNSNWSNYCLLRLFLNRTLPHLNSQQFDLDHNEHGELQVIWDKQYHPKSRRSIAETTNFFRSQIRRLLRLKIVDWNSDYDEIKDIDMTRSEWDTIWKFVDANVEAMRAAMDSLQDNDNSQDTCLNDAGTEGSCTVPVAVAANSHYDMLDKQWDDLPYAQDTCEFRRWMKGYKANYPVIEKTQTMYQALIFKEHPGHDDICMELDKIVQVNIGRRKLLGDRLGVSHVPLFSIYGPFPSRFAAITDHTIMSM
jgi:hypothetical protein